MRAEKCRSWMPEEIKSVPGAGKVQVGTEEEWVPLLLPPQGRFRDREKVTAVLGLM